MKIFLSVFALLLAGLIVKFKPSLPDRFCVGVVLVILGGGAVISFMTLKMSGELFLSSPDSLVEWRATLSAMGSHSWLFAGVAAVVLLCRWTPSSAVCGLAAVASLALAVVFWDARTDYRRASDQAASIAEFAAIIREKQGEIYWADSTNEVWQRLGRPSWLSVIQSWPIVFSRDQAMLWKARRAQAEALGVDHDWRLDPNQKETPAPALSADKLNALCTSANAPAWVIWPLFRGEMAPSDLAPLAQWTPPHDLAAYHLFNGEVKEWTVREKLMLFACARRPDKRV
jgi:hypothetical protein